MRSIPEFVLVGLCVAVVGCGAAPEDGAREEAARGRDAAAQRDSLMLTEGGASAYRILVRSSASPSETQAATDLQAEILAATGAELPIETGDAAGETPSIVLGCGAAAKSLGVDPTPESLGDQGFVLKTVEPHVVIAGTAAVGTLYGVYDFLERVFDVRWLTEQVTVHERADVPLPALDVIETPAFLWRTTTYEWLAGDGFRARHRANAGDHDPESPYGLQFGSKGSSHSYHNFVSPGEFFETHPEYFSEIGGERLAFETQLCLTNPEVLEIVSERMIESMAAHPQLRHFNFSQEDYYNYCECADCTAMNTQYQTMGGTQFWFVNQLAERTSKMHPDKLISTLAYMYTEEPPVDMTMHPNVSVWLCHMYPSCDSHPVATCPLNADFKRRAETWSKLSQHLYVWHYVTDFAHYYNPFPNLRSIAADMRFYNSLGVEGVYLQGMGHGGGGGEFSNLRPYYGMKLSWNPNQDAQAIIDQFLQGYYGPAADAIGRYVTMLHDHVDENNIHIHLYVNPGQGHVPDEILAKADALFDEAEAAVSEDEELLERVKVARMPLSYARVFPRNGYTIAAGEAGADGLRADTLTFNGAFATATEMQEFLERMKRHGFETIREWGGDPQQVVFFPLIFGSPMALPVIENDYLAVNVAPVLGARALAVIDKRTGQCVTAINTVKNLYFPFCGGEESRIGGMFAANMTGNMLQFQVVEHMPASITLKAAGGGFDIVRKLSLADDAPVLAIETTVTNTGDKPREARMRSHLDLDLGVIEDTQVSFIARDGSEVSKDMRPIIANLREGEHFADEGMPNGAWSLTGSKGLTLMQRFDPDAVVDAWVYAYPADLNDLEIELEAQPVTVAPGESHTFRHECEVR